MTFEVLQRTCVERDKTLETPHPVEEDKLCYDKINIQFRHNRINHDVIILKKKETIIINLNTPINLLSNEYFQISYFIMITSNERKSMFYYMLSS